MRFNHVLVVGVLALLLTVPVAGQYDETCQERLDRLEQEARQAIENATSDENREELRERYEMEIEELREECQRESDDAYQTQPIDDEEDRSELDEGSCRQRASAIKDSFVDAVQDVGVMAVDGPIQEFIDSRETLVERCSIFGPDEVVRNDSAEVERRVVERHEAVVEESGQSIGIPEDVPDACREELEKIREEYQADSGEDGSIDPGSINAFRERVEDVMNDCERNPRIVDISDAPERISEECIQDMRELNEDIMDEADVDTGDVVPEGYRETYMDRLRSCRNRSIAHAGSSTATAETRESGSSNAAVGEDVEADEEVADLEEQLRQKEQRIQELEQRIEQLESSRSAEEGAGAADETIDEEVDERGDDGSAGAVDEQPQADGDLSGTGGIDEAEVDQEAERDEQSETENRSDNRRRGIIDRIASIFR